MTLWSWSQTASNNGNADSTVNYLEGQTPSSLNDSARGAMAAVAKYRDDIAGAITTGGTATAYTVTSYQVFDTLAHMNGAMIAFTPHATNTNAVGVDVTLNVDGLGAKSIRAQPSVALPNGSLVLGTPYVAVYNNSDAVWYLKSGYTNPYNIPLAGGMDFWGTSVPNSSFAFPIGQAISRTTYASLFAIMATTYGPGDGSTTFNLPDKGERVSVMKVGSASRILSALNSTSMGSSGGAETHTLTASEIPSITSSNTGTVTVTTAGATSVPQNSSIDPNTFGNGGSLISGYKPGANGALVSHADPGTINLTSNNTGGTAHLILQPTIVCNYIIRVI